MDNEEDVRLLIDSLSHQSIKPELIVFDTLARSMIGNESSTPDMGKVVRALDLIGTSLSSQIILIHHSGKDQRRGLRGSGSLEGATDVIFKTSCSRENEVSLINERQKDSELARPMVFLMNTVNTGFSTSDGDAVTSLVPVFDPISTEKIRNKPESKEDIHLSRFRDAWAYSGTNLKEGNPFLSKSDFKRFLADTTELASKTIDNHTSPSDKKKTIGYLIHHKFIRTVDEGWIAIDERLIEELKELIDSQQSA